MDLNLWSCWLLRFVQGHWCGWWNKNFTTIELRLRSCGSKLWKLWIPLWSPHILYHGVSTLCIDGDIHRTLSPRLLDGSTHFFFSFSTKLFKHKLLLSKTFWCSFDNDFWNPCSLMLRYVPLTVWMYL